MKQLRLAKHYLDLWHEPQVHPWGCMHHALYACTGEERALGPLDDMSTQGLARLTWQLGFWRITWYNHPGKVKADASLWEAVLKQWPDDYLVFNASIDSLKYADTTHSVALAFNLSGCIDLPGAPFAVVSDSGVNDFVQFKTLVDFLASPYAGVYALHTFYRLPLEHVPEMVWTLGAPHLASFDWSQYPPYQASRPAPLTTVRDTP